MSLTQAVLGEIEYEAASTRRMFKALPDEHWNWKPHEKSFTLGQLAAHVAEIFGWAAGVVKSDSFDFASGYAPPKAANVNELLALLDQNAKKAEDALKAAPNDLDWHAMWTLRNGDEIYFRYARIQTMRGSVIKHICHHRGQLAVYLRLLDKPVPGMYGPSADEMENVAHIA